MIIQRNVFNEFACNLVFNINERPHLAMHLTGNKCTQFCTEQSTILSFLPLAGVILNRIISYFPKISYIGWHERGVPNDENKEDIIDSLMQDQFYMQTKYTAHMSCTLCILLNA